MSRTDFEAAYIERYGHRPRGWNDDFQVYQDAHANGAWFGWQARAAGIEAKAAPVGEREAFEAIAADDNFGILRVMDAERAEHHNLEAGDYLDLAARTAWRYFQAGAAHQRQQAREVVMPSAEILADLFVGCPLPKTVRVDECALDPDYPHRFGTNLLTWGEARLMFGEMLARMNKGAGSHE